VYNPNDPDWQRPTDGQTARRTAEIQDEGLLANGLKQVKRLVVSVIGGTVLLVGIIMLVVPGPGLIVIPLGLGILAIEFAWARRLLRKFREQGVHLRDSIGGKKAPANSAADRDIRR
jgi:hypothetical protein